MNTPTINETAATQPVRELVIRILPTPNPFALKFVADRAFKEEGKASFNVPQECENLPMIRDIFSVEGVRQVHVFQNTITVTHSGELDNEQFSDQVRSIITTRFPIHDPKFGEPTPPVKERVKSSDPLLEQIEEILDRTIRPGLQSDGGDIEVLSFENNELRIVYQGACGGCPSAMMGTLDAIQGILRNELSNPDLMVSPV